MEPVTSRKDRKDGILYESCRNLSHRGLTQHIRISLQCYNNGFYDFKGKISVLCSVIYFSNKNNVVFGLNVG